MFRHLAVLTFIFICTSAAWVVLGSITAVRTSLQDDKLRKVVGELWGQPQKQKAPSLYRIEETIREIVVIRDKTPAKEIIRDTVMRPVFLSKTDISVDLELEHRKKGLLWYSTYKVSFSGNFVVKNYSEEENRYVLRYHFPVEDGVYNGFTLKVNGNSIDNLDLTEGQLSYRLKIPPDEERVIDIAYSSQGLDEWWYLFGSGVTQTRDFRLTMNTDFFDINFPENSISPTKKTKTEKGWKLNWEYKNLVSGIQIGMELPSKLNPGPFVSRVSFFAPVSLFFFFFIIFMITAIKRIKMHPMNYFFLAGAFFAFHILLAYLVDHINVHLAAAICSIVSVFLVISYMRLVVGLRFALIETGLSQLVYLIIFTYAFFLEGYTGLTITILSISTLFVVMQLTGRVDWEKQLALLSKDNKEKGVPNSNR